MQNKKRLLIMASACTLSMSITNTLFADDAKSNGHELDVKFRTMYLDRVLGHRSQSAFGTEFNYKSPKIANVFNVGISAYAVEKLGHSGKVKTDILPAVNGRLKPFGLIGQAYVEITPTKNASFKLGRQKQKSIFLSSSGSRAVPSTYSGVSGKVNVLKNLSLYGSIYDEWSPRTSDEFVGFATDQSKNGAIDYVSVLGAKFKTGPFTLEAEYLNSKDYLSKFGLRGTYRHKLAEHSKIKLTGGYFTSSDDGNLFVTGSESGELDDEDIVGSTPGVTRSSNDGQGAFIEAAWKKNKTTISAAIAKFDDAWLEDNFAGDHGRNPFPTRATLGPDLANANETAAVLKLEHDWKGTINGLKGTIAFGKGWNAENSALGKAGGSADEDFVEAKLAYKVPALKGLKLTAKYYNYNSDKTGNIDGVKSDQEQVRLYADYTYKF